MSDLAKQLKKLDIHKLKMKNGNTVEKELERHASYLADCIMYELDKVYDSYTPKVYERSYGLYNSLRIGDVSASIRSSGASLSIELTFDDGAFHRGFDGKWVNTAILINEGFETGGKFKNVPYLGYRDATHFIEKGIQRYKKGITNPFDVRLSINGENRKI